MSSFSISNFIKLLHQNWSNHKKIYICSIVLFFILNIIYSFNGLRDYLSVYYLLFTIASFFFFINSVFISNLFTQKFIGLFLFLGFWIKFNFNILYNNNVFPEYVTQLHQMGGGSISPHEHDLLKTFFICSSIFFLTIPFASKFLLNLNHINKKINFFNLFLFVKFFNRRTFFFSFLLFFILIYFNYKYQFYIRGIVPSIENIFITGFYKCLFSYVVLILSALFLDFYIKKEENFLQIFIILLFILFINQLFHLSRLSPVLILPLFLALLHYIFSSDTNFINNKKILYIILLSIFLSFICWYLVFKLRNSIFFENYNFFESYNSFEPFIKDKKNFNYEYHFSSVKNIYTSFFIERWIGADGLLTIIGNKTRIGYDYFFNNSSFSFVSGRLKSIFIIGPAAFFFKSGSYIIFFLSTFLAVFLISNIENLFNNLFKNLYFFQYFFAFILAYEFIHIGAGTIKSFIYYISIIFFVFFLYFLNYFFKKIK
jgi:hypothetical protein